MGPTTISEPREPTGSSAAGRRIVLIRFPGDASAPDSVPGSAPQPSVPSALTEAVERSGFGQADLSVHQSLDSRQCCAYLLAAPAQRSVTDDAYRRLCKALASGMPAASAARLLALMELDGASASSLPTHHYVVETDVVATAEADLNAWYDQEHMPGLAAVPGSVRAARYRNLDEGPRYHACYDLASLQTFGSPAWLQVRATEWSSRVRPMFLNTRRTMFRTLAHPPCT
jgi:hypothetical protein